MSKVMDAQYFFHCGLDIVKEENIKFDFKDFCCNGCKTVYEIFSINDITPAPQRVPIKSSANVS